MTTNVFHVIVATIVGAMGVAIAVAPARAEDPAITACEAAVKDVSEGTTYRRLNATLSEAQVVIDYETKFKKDRAEKASHTCSYRHLPASDEFIFTFDVHKACKEIIARNKIESWERETFRTCEQLVALKRRLQAVMEGAVRGLGIYPISAKDTALSTIASKE